jgi:hypothetical protein
MALDNRILGVQVWNRAVNVLWVPATRFGRSVDPQAG